LKAKSEALGAFQTYKLRGEKESGKEIRRLKTDGGGEYISHQFQTYLRKNGISHSISPPYTPKQNGLAERANRTLMESARCMIVDADLEKGFWGFAVGTAAHIHNRLPSRSHDNKSPLEYWIGKPASLGHMRIFGSATYTLIPAEKRKKLDPRSTQCILLGYDEDAGSRVYRVYDPISKRVFSSRDVIVDEQGRKDSPTGESENLDEMEISSPDISEKETHAIISEIAPQEFLVAESRNPPDLEEFGGDTIVVRPPENFAETRGRTASTQGPRRSERQRNRSQQTNSVAGRAMYTNVEEPQTLQEALAQEDSDN